MVIIFNNSNNFIKKIVNNPHPYFIAEVGINHNGSVDLAKKMIKAAKLNGADCVKFQSFIADEYISSIAEKANYQNQKGLEKKTQKEIIKECELSIEYMQELKDYAKKQNIDFLCTPFEVNSLRKLIGINIEAIKISSCNLTNYPFLEEAAKSGLPVLLSTGMGTMEEVTKAVDIFNNHKSPLFIFQCTSNYPSNIDNSNINVIETYQKTFNLPVGLSDHTTNNIAAIAAVAIGALAVEKHFTISRELPGIDQQASIIPSELKQIVEDLRDCKKSLGSFKKFRTEEENDTFTALRRSLVASRDIKEGEIIDKKMIDIMRPGNGLSTDYLDMIVGKKSNKAINKHSLIKLEDLNI